MKPTIEELEKRVLELENQISNEKLKVDKLENQINSFQSIFNNGKIAWWKWELNSEEIQYSPNIISLLGYNINEFPSNIHKIYELIHPADLNDILAIIKNHLQGNTPFYEITYRILSKSGEYLYCFDYGKIVEFDSFGEPKILTGLIINVNEHYKHQEGLNKAKQNSEINAIKLIEYQNIAKLGGWELDIQNGIFTFTDSFYKLYHTSVEEMGGYDMTIQDYSAKFVHPDDAYMVAEETKKALSSGNPDYSNYVEHRIIYADGGIGVIGVRFYIVKDDNGNTIKTYGVNQDITERITREEELKNLNHKYLSFISQSREAVYCTEFDKPIDINLPIEQQIDEIYTQAYMGHCNQAMVDMYGAKSINEFVGSRLIEFHGGKDNPINRQTWKTFIENNYQTRDLETIELSADNKPLYFLSNDTGFIENGKLVRIWGTSINITQKKQIELELINAKERAEQSEKLYRLLAENSSDVVWVLDLDFNYLYLSPSSETLFGYSIAERKQMKFQDIYSKEEVEYLNLLIQNKLNLYYQTKNNDPMLFELKGFHKNGQIITLEINAKFVIENEKILAIQGTTRNITERKKAEQDLIKAKERAEESEHNYYMIFNSVGTSNSIFDREGILRRQNLESIKTLGVDGIGMNVFQLFGDKIGKSVFDRLTRVFQTGIKEEFETEFNLDTIKGWFKSSYNPIYDENKDIIFIQVISQDITNLKNAQIQLIKEKERAEASEKQMIIAQRTSKVGNWFWNIKENHLWWSDEMYHIFDISKDNFTGDLEAVVAKSIHPDDKEKVIQSNHSVINNNNPYPVEYRIISKDGSIKYVLGLADNLTLDENGNSISLTGIVKDITEYKIMQNELTYEKERAEESDKLKTAFLQNMSHEIRTPLNGILGFADLLLQDDIEKNAIKEYTTIIMKSGERLLTTIGNIIDISRIETNQIELNYQPFNLNSLLEDNYLFFSKLAHTKNLKLSYKCELDNSIAIIETDQTKLNQVLTNLINNSIKFSFNGEIEFGYKVKEGNLEFYIKDTGTGIPEKLQHRIFKRFTQADISISSGYEGSGLGLAISKGLVEILGGTIWFDSKENVGTTFYFTIPFSDFNRHKFELNLQQKIKYSSNSKKILLAEDDEVTIQYMEILLRKKGYNFIIARNGQQVVDLLMKNPDLSLILMDIKMPVLNGIDAAKLAKSIKPDIIIIAQTAFASTQERDNILLNKFDDYISKPIKTDELIKTLEKYL